MKGGDRFEPEALRFQHREPRVGFVYIPGFPSPVLFWVLLQVGGCQWRERLSRAMYCDA